MALRLYNTAVRARQEFQPFSPPDVRMYVCGPTVYDYIHIGNARVFIVFDVIRRYLKWRGFRVTMVQNYTDIDDKMIQRARDEGVTVQELAERYIEAYREDVCALKIHPADFHPRATGHIPQIVALIELLQAKGLAYDVAGNVYFDTTRFSDYGSLSQQKKEELLAGARVDPAEDKRHPLDFALWKSHKSGEPFWESPWGKGRPGWHIECSAMAMHYLGKTIDIHAGGSDLVFPHHENEAAQSEAATGKRFARYWMHAGYLNLEEQKMSKSLGNVLTVRELLVRFNPLDLRFFILSAHYRSPLNFSEALVRQAAQGRERLQELVNNLDDALAGSADEGQGESVLPETLRLARESFIAAMDDDFNTADGIAVLFELARECNKYLRRSHPYRRALLEQAIAFYRETDEVLGILKFDAGKELEQELADAIAAREDARRRKDWPAADRIRSELAAKGIILEDTLHGVRWKRGAKASATKQ